MFHIRWKNTVYKILQLFLAFFFSSSYFHSQNPHVFSIPSIEFLKYLFSVFFSFSTVIPPALENKDK